MPRMTGVKVLGIEANFVMEALDRVAKEAPVGSNPPVGSETDRRQVARRAQRLAPVLQGAHVLIVNDVQEDVEHFARLLEALGMGVRIVKQTSAAFEALTDGRMNAIISDVRRGNVADEGIRFFNQLRRRSLHHPQSYSVCETSNQT